MPTRAWRVSLGKGLQLSCGAPTCVGAGDGVHDVRCESHIGRTGDGDIS